MHSAQLHASFSRLSTPLVCDACLRLGVRYKVPPPGLRPLRPPVRIAGRVRPARHYGSVDVFLEALETAEVGDILVIDNGGRLDEACIGDLIVLEAQSAQLGGITVWGVHRDTAELAVIDLPVFSYGTCPSGPQRLDARPPDALTSACFGSFRVDASDFVVGDDDGLVFAPVDHAEQIFGVAERILSTERAQAEAIRAGTPLRVQLRFPEYLDRIGKFIFPIPEAPVTQG
jgi:4-hydroxy-4-methyl-2-oxoglutarate aldolase